MFLLYHLKTFKMIFSIVLNKKNLNEAHTHTYTLHIMYPRKQRILQNSVPYVYF